MEYKDYYKILEVDKKADKDTIKKAYRKLAKKFHPDNNPGNKRAEEKFKEMNEAYEVLSNDEKRKRYDTMGSADMNGSGFDPSQYSQQNTYRKGGFDPNGGYSSVRNDFSDFFNAFFGDLGMGGMGRDPFAGSSRKSTSQRTAAVPDSEAEMKVSIEDALAEREMVVSINDKKVNLKIPKGIRSGQQIKMKGQGQDGGNLLIRIELIDTPSLTLEEDDLVKTVDIYPWQAYQGTQVQVMMPDNTFKVTIPEKIKGGSRIRMREQGYYRKDKTRGDLYIKINIVNPTSLSDKDKEIYKDLSNRYRL